MALTTIGDRLTPSIPIQITFDAQKLAVGTKVTTLIGHCTTSPSLEPNSIHEIIDIGDSTSAQLEVDGLAGQGSEIGKMAKAFIDANALAGRATFPAFRVLMLANGDTGVAAEGVEKLKALRSDMIVSPYPVGSAANNGLLDLVEFISGPDRDLQGQFGSFLTVGSLDPISVVQTYTYNSQKLIIASLPDTSTTPLQFTGDTASGSPQVANLDSLEVQIGQMVQSSAIVGGSATILSVDLVAKTLTLSSNVNVSGSGTQFTAMASASAQPANIVAAAHAGAMMASTFPYNPLKGVVVGGLVPPSKMSDRVQIDPFGSSEALLRAGVSPMYVAPGNKVALIKTRTSYKLLPDGVTAVTDYNAWQQLVTLNDFRESLYQVCQNPPFNNNPGGTKASLTVANALLGEFVRLALSFEDQGAFQGVKSLVKEFEVEPSPLRRGRFDFRLPVNVLPDLDVVAINVFSTTKFDFTL
jgi:phage tail sheath gpL-like